MNIINKVRVNICGKDYNLQTDEQPEYLYELAARINKEISELVKAKPNFGIQSAAVFVALTSLDEAHKAGESIENIRTQIKTYVDDAAKARAAKERLSERVKELEARITELEKENKELKKRPPIYDCEQLVLENTISPSVTIYTEENENTKNQPTDDAKDNSVREASDIEETVPATETAGKNESKNDDNKNILPAADNGCGASCSSDEKPQQDSGTEETAPVSDGSGAENTKAENDGASAQDNNMIEKNRSGKGRKKKH